MRLPGGSLVFLASLVLIGGNGMASPPATVSTDAPTGGAASQPLSEEDAAFYQQLERVLRQRPELILDIANLAQRRIQERQAIERDAAARSVYQDILANEPASLAIGASASASTVTIVEMLDYNCGHCRNMYGEVDKLLQLRPGVRVQIVMTPILGPSSDRLARFALAASLQGGFAKAHEAFFTSDAARDPSDQGLEALASRLKLDWPSIRTEMQGKRVEEMLARHRGYWERLGRNGTPSFLMSDKLIVGAVPASSLAAALPAK